jgi:probable phosphomutase (TIGR03848 family)
VTTVLLVRHGRTAANTGGVLAGWSAGVGLDDTGQAQATALAQRLAPVELTAVVTSPLQRCQETAQALLRAQVSARPKRPAPPQHDDPHVGEVRYGDWTGQPLKDLAKQPLWKVVQAHPSAAVFPGEGGEGLAAMQSRAVAAVRRWNVLLGPDAVYAVVSHGDVIKAILADALGLHLDQFQRIVVDPASLSVVTYTPQRPFVVRVNDVGGSVAVLAAKRRRRRNDAVVGGGAGEGR